MPSAQTVVELLRAAPAGNTAIILPESGIRITYENLLDQVMAMAGSLAAVGIESGHRVASVFPNGLPAIVSFLAASVAGTASPLNPAYRRDEFKFYLEDVEARLLLVPPDGAEDAREAAREWLPVYSVEMDDKGLVGIVGAPTASKARTPHPDDVALILHTSGSTGRPKRVPIRHSNIGASSANIGAHYGPHAVRRFSLRDAALSRARPGRFGAVHVSFRWHRRRTRKIQPAFVLALRSRYEGLLVFRRAHDPLASSCARRQPTSRGRRKSPVHTLGAALRSPPK